MLWSKLKKTIEDKFADCVKGRVQLYTTRYTSGSYFMVRGWITLDGKEIANFSTPDNYQKYGWNTPEINERIPAEERTKGKAVEKGEFSRWDFVVACFDYINLSINEAIAVTTPSLNHLLCWIKDSAKEDCKYLIKKIFTR